MMPLGLLWPWALAGLLAIPALVLIYWLRQRTRTQAVPSLLLWRRQRPERQEGARRDRFHAPPLFWLELAILALLILAAAGPTLWAALEQRPLVVVLDDSFSMTVELSARSARAAEGRADTPRQRAAEALRRELDTGGRRHGDLTLVLAGDTPQVLARLPRASTATRGASWEGLDNALTGWRCGAPRANLGAALSLASELGGPRARILVLSDHRPPEGDPGPGHLEWRAFGRAAPNLAIVGAVRGGEAGGDRILLEIANYSTRPAETTLELRALASLDDPESPPESSVGIEEVPLRLAPGEVVRQRLGVPDELAIQATLDGDRLPMDDRVILLPETAAPVAVALDLAEGGDRDLIERTLASDGRARFGALTPELVIRGPEDPPTESPGTWEVVVVAEDDALAYLGPFVVDRRHPLGEGLGLSGVVWAAGRSGMPAAASTQGTRWVVRAGDVPLLGDLALDGGRHRLTLRWRRDLSTLARSPDWPILWSNLLQWRISARPGPRPVNARLGSAITVVRPPVDVSNTPEPLRLRSPGGTEQSLGAGQEVRWTASTVGLHAVVDPAASGDASVRHLAVNALAPLESDLGNLGEGVLGSWEDPEGQGTHRRLSLTWLCLLGAAGLLVWHRLLSRGGGR